MSLLAWYPFNGDLKNIGLDGIDFLPSIDDPQYNTGKLLEKSLYFPTPSTVNNRIERPQFDKVDDFSVSCWLKLPDYTIRQQENHSCFIFTQGRADYNSDGWGIILGKDRNVFRLRYGSYNTEDPVTYIEFDPDIWFNLTFTVSKEGYVKIYVNGELKHEKLAGTKPDYSEGTGTFTIGCFGYNISQYIYPTVFQIQDFRYYDEELSPLEVKELSKGLILHYNFEDLVNSVNNLYYNKELFVYNNYSGSNPSFTPSGVPEMEASVQELSETYQGAKIYRLKIKALTQRALEDLQTYKGNHGIRTSIINFKPNEYNEFSILYRVETDKAIEVGGVATNYYSDFNICEGMRDDNPVRNEWYVAGQIKTNVSQSTINDQIYISIKCPEAELNEEIIIDFCQPRLSHVQQEFETLKYYNKLPELIIKDSSGFNNDGIIERFNDPSDQNENLAYGLTQVAWPNDTEITLGSDSKGDYFIANSKQYWWSGIKSSDRIIVEPGKVYIKSIWLKAEQDTEVTIDANTAITSTSEDNDAYHDILIGPDSSKDEKEYVKLYAHKWKKLFLIKRIKDDVPDNLYSFDYIVPKEVGVKIYYKDNYFGEVINLCPIVYDTESNIEGKSRYITSIDHSTYADTTIVEKDSGAIGNILTQNIEKKFTISFWVSLSLIESPQSIFSCGYRYASDSSKEGRQAIDDADKYLHILVRDNGLLSLGLTHDDLENIYDFTNHEDEWTHCAFTIDQHYDDSQLQDVVEIIAYINGEEKAHKNSLLSELDFINGQSFMIGASFYPSTNIQEWKYFGRLSGQIDDFRIYATSLSKEDIKKLYNVKARMDNHNNVITNNLIEQYPNILTKQINTIESISSDGINAYTPSSSTGSYEISKSMEYDNQFKKDVVKIEFTGLGEGTSPGGFYIGTNNPAYKQVFNDCVDGKEYIVSYWIKSNRINQVVNGIDFSKDHPTYTRNIYPNEWTKVSFRFTSDKANNQYNGFTFYNANYEVGDIYYLTNLRVVLNEDSNNIGGVFQTYYNVNDSAFIKEIDSNSFELTKSSSLGGMEILNTFFKEGLTYKLSFYIRKISGTLYNVVGHAAAYICSGRYIDGKYMDDTWYKGKVDESEYLNDGKLHYIETYLKYDTETTASQKKLYIQPNRYYSGDIKVEIYDLDLHALSDTELDELNKNIKIDKNYNITSTGLIEKDTNKVKQSSTGKLIANDFIEL